MNLGYILLWRQFKDTSFFKDSYAVHLALHLIMEANHKDKKTIFNGDEIVIKRGQVLTGRKSLSLATGIKMSTVRNKLELLQNIGFLDIKSNNRFSIITIYKYNTFQNPAHYVEQRKGQPEDSQRTTKGQPEDTSKECNNENNENKETLAERFKRFWKAYPKKASKGTAEKVWNRINPSEQLLAIMIAMIEQAKTSEQWRKEKGQFIPHPATWLNAKGWEDEHGDTETEDDYRRIYRDAFGAGEGV